MPFLIKGALVVLAGSGAFKLVTGGVDDLASATTKLAASGAAVGAAYLVAKKMKVI